LPDRLAAYNSRDDSHELPAPPGGRLLIELVARPDSSYKGRGPKALGGVSPGQAARD